ncbi:selenoneine biosynthesis selenosugar synthase SenB [Neopusillimonas maritima]|uniref:TIGR04348 family glycosyltransferase n=1 Tax=Neopusillimonas maritima TaxID=2026239 RepID=A0ABX9MXW8_9BURK|nr:selenoneine biosynthesis selenosugar synthase SenB [Neopusillimonas maritima]RII83819.1 TIGR04348 family glycosyltransferase [Neopusillimonas maritima]
MALNSNQKPKVTIVTPSLAAANNGNWQTVRRWARAIAPVAQVSIVQHWPGDDTSAEESDVLIALHARRSAPSISNWYARHGSRGLAVIMAGTDLYRDINYDPDAQRSLQQAHSLVVLQEKAPEALAPAERKKTRLIFQSTSLRKPLAKTTKHLRVLMVGHLRPEKAPHTLFQVTRLLKTHPDIYIDHIGKVLDPALGEAAQQTMLEAPNYRWIAGLPHDTVRSRIQRAHLLVHTSEMEGGAHVVMEAVNSGTPVLASDVDGNIGMLGKNYQGYFPFNNANVLAESIKECRATQSDENGLLNVLSEQCRDRAKLFDPKVEQHAIQTLVKDLLGVS